MNDDFLPDDFNYVYTMGCSETIARISFPAVQYYNCDMVSIEAKRNLEWVIQIHSLHKAMDESESMDFFYTCGVLYFTFSALSKKVDVNEELKTIKSLLSDAIQNCKQFPEFVSRVEFDDSITEADQSWYTIKNFWNWKRYIMDYDSCFHIDPYSEFQLRCRKEYGTLYKNGTCSEETYGFNLFVMMEFAEKWPEDKYKEANKIFCHWVATSEDSNNYKHVFNNFILNYYYAYCYDKRNTKGNLYNFCRSYETFIQERNKYGNSVDGSVSGFENERVFLFTTITCREDLCKWATYDSLFKDSTRGLENLINTVFGIVFAADNKSKCLQIIKDIKTDYHDRYEENPGVVICLFYLVRSMELFDFESVFGIENFEDHSKTLNDFLCSEIKALKDEFDASKINVVVAENGKQAAIDKSEDILISMMLYFAVWEFIGFWNCEYTIPTEENHYLSVPKNKLLLPLFYEGFLNDDFDYVDTLKKIMNESSKLMNFNKENCFENVNFSDKMTNIRIIYTLSKVYMNNKDSIINLMQYVHELQMRNYPLFIDTKTEFKERNILIKRMQSWESNKKKIQDSDFGFVIPELYQSFFPFNTFKIERNEKIKKNVTGVYGESVESFNTIYENFPHVLNRNITCKFMSETDKAISVSILKEKLKLRRDEDFNISHKNTIETHYMYDDRSMSVHERVLKSIKELTEENKVLDLIKYLYEINEYLIKFDESSNNSMGIQFLKKELNIFAKEIIKKIRPQKEFTDVWEECIGEENEPNVTDEELKKFSLQDSLGNDFIYELQDFLGIITCTKGIVDSDNRTTDFISLYSTQIVIYLIYLAYAFRSQEKD